MSGEERTHKATPQRMKEVRKKGGLGRSQDLSAWIGLGAAAVMLPSVLGRAREQAQDQLAHLGGFAAQADPQAAMAFAGESLRSVLGTVAPMLVAVFLVTMVVGVAQGGVHLSPPRLHAEHLNPTKGIKQLFSVQQIWQATKTLAKSAVIAIVVWSSLQALIPTLLASGRLPLAGLVGTTSSGVTGLLRLGIVAGIALAVVDVFVVVRRNRKQTRMTTQEVKDEAKRTEGDPQIKGQIRARQRAMSRNRMMAAVAEADVVVVNPTHVAVALRYTPGAGAPRVVAKGSGLLATRIRERATEHRVPLVEDIPLARALHAACEVGGEIPEYLFAAVARVLAFVMALRRRGAAAGQHRVPGGSALPGVAPDDDHKARARAAAREKKAREKARRIKVTPLETP